MGEKDSGRKDRGRAPSVPADHEHVPCDISPSGRPEYLLELLSVKGGDMHIVHAVVYENVFPGDGGWR